MAKTIVGLFDTFSQAQRVVDDLTSAGIDRSNISLVRRNRDDGIATTTTDMGDTTTADAVGAGAIGGGVLGGTLGLLVGIGALVIPGIGPVIAAGPLAAALGSAAVGAGIGAAAGGLIGALVGAGVPEEEAHVYAEGVRRGGTLVTVNADDMMADRVYSIMRGAGAADINTKATGWRSEGWSRFDERAEPYPLSDVDDTWERSSKIGTTGGAVAGAATGAAMGSAAGPVGTVIGGAAGAAVGAGVGAAGDVAGESLEDNVEESRAVGAGSWSTYEPTFRNDYSSRYANSGYTWDQYSTAYRYGYNAATDQRYYGRHWNDVETTLRGGWDESRYGPWNRFKDAVQHAWERAKDAVT
jgi:hypothetical protein